MNNRASSASVSVVERSPGAGGNLFAASPEQIRRASEEELRQLQKLAGLGSVWGVIEIEEGFQTGLRISALDLRRFPGSKVKCKKQPSPTTIREMMRAAIAMAIIPGRNRKTHKRTTIRVNMANLQRLIQRSHVPERSKRIWSCIENVDALSEAYKGSLAVVSYYHRLGCLPDGPVTERPRVVGEAPARDRTGESEHTANVRQVKVIQPYSDEFVSEAGWMSTVMIELIGPTLLDAVEAALAVVVPTERRRGSGPLRSPGQTAIARDPVIESWDWRGPDGKKLLEVPLRFSIKKGASRETASWPPRTFQHALRLVTVLQGAHAFPIALCGGPRHGELLSMETGSVRRRGRTDVYELRTWKLEGEGGRKSELPAPSIAVHAIQQQERLAKMFRDNCGVDGSNLWISLKHPDRVPSMLVVFRNFVSVLGLSRLVTNGGMNPHRFRKTLARIVALALVQAPKVLMDVFGHRDEQMTIMRYILSDQAILSEVQQVVREMLILKGVEAITRSQEVQGAGSGKLRVRVQMYARRLGRSALEPQNVLEFARAMTAEGTSWAVIAPGIVCTNFTEGGLCNKGHGQANPHYCHPACENQLILPDETSAASSSVVQAIQTVEFNLELLQQASEDEDMMLMAQFRGQIKSVLGRWKEVDEHFKRNALLARLVPNVEFLK